MERRIVVLNPNSDQACTAAIAAAVTPFARPGLARFDTIRLENGPPAIATWRDWFGVALPLCAVVQAEPGDAYIIACVSDPGIEAVREVTERPVLGVFRAAVLSALAHADRIGVIAFVEASKARQRRVLLSLGVEDRVVATEALNLPMPALTDPELPRAALLAAGGRLIEAGSQAVVLGCAGMARHRPYLESKLGVPVIEPCAAAAAQALLTLL